MSRTIGVVVFPGSNCDEDCRYVLEQIAHTKVVMLWHQERSLGAAGAPTVSAKGQATRPLIDAIILPGGFSYGDYLRAGALARLSPIMQAVSKFAARGGPVLGICNGFQILCEAGLLPGTLARNAELNFICEDTQIRLESNRTPFTAGLSVGRALTMPVAHRDGRYMINDKDLERIEGEEQVVFRYLHPLNGSLSSIAGVCSQQRNVVGLMPHPERAAEAALGSTDGLSLFQALLNHLDCAEV